MARSSRTKFWKLLSDAKFIGSPSKLTDDDVRRMANTVGLFEPELEAVLCGLRDFQSGGPKNSERQEGCGRSGTK